MIKPTTSFPVFVVNDLAAASKSLRGHVMTLDKRRSTLLPLPPPLEKSNDLQIILSKVMA